VIPLNEECGLIEWVPKTTGFRHILTALYGEIGLDGKKQREEVKNIYKEYNGTPTVVVWEDIMNRLYPPVFYKWFLVQFPEPIAWFHARVAYARTAAVMSIVGYIVGLGDRHGENILFDATNGDAVHVDFNCLFFKGMTFENPKKSLLDSHKI